MPSSSLAAAAAVPMKAAAEVVSLLLRDQRTLKTMIWCPFTGRGFFSL